MLRPSPGTSTAVFIMLDVRCFPDQLKTCWSTKLKEMIPSNGQSLINNAALCRKVRSYTSPFVTCPRMICGDQDLSGMDHEGFTAFGGEFENAGQRDHILRNGVIVPVEGGMRRPGQR